MDEVAFVKMHGAGNDFIMVEDLAVRFDPDRSMIAALCASHRGIGADGLIILRPSDRAAFSMKYYNSDGGEAELCGNGARCVALLAYRLGITGRSMQFEARSGPVKAEILDDGVNVDIGKVRDLRLGIDLDMLPSKIHTAFAGVPHAVVLTQNTRDYSSEAFVTWARPVRSHASFSPEGVNVNLVAVIDRNRLAYRTYERGVERETLACGTGAIASAVVTSHLGMTESPVSCETGGGDLLSVTFEKTSSGAEGCMLKGPAEVAFEGTFRQSDYRP
ncbi:MAG: diaminopimelate epimerase [bacterium]|nr:MAG: diaminopimelate epimerase [bacterium]